MVREHAGRLAVALMAVTGDFATAEDLVQDAVVTALRRWPTEGIPDRPDAWLFTVARNRGLDVLRREPTTATKLAQLQWPVQPEPDERLRLIFTCCHPALSRPAQIALTLRVVCGLTTAQIARAFLVPETTVAQRITRAKRKIADAGIPYRIPDPDELNARLSEVLAVIYLLLNEGYLSTAEQQAQSRDLVDDAEWLATLLHQLMPTEPEVTGLLALISCTAPAPTPASTPTASWCCSSTRTDPAGTTTPSPRRPSSWPRPPDNAARPLPAPGRHRRLPRRSQGLGRHRLGTDRAALRHAPAPGPVAGHPPAPGRRPALHRRRPSRPRRARHPRRHARRLPPLPRHPRRAPPRLGHPYQARTADEGALELTANPAEQALLQQRIHWT